MTPQLVLTWIQIVVAIIPYITILIKPIREKLFGYKLMRDALMALLSNSMTNMYYAEYHSRTLKRHQYELFMDLYAAYKAFGGNHFIDKIHEEIEHDWTIE